MTELSNDDWVGICVLAIIVALVGIFITALVLGKSISANAHNNDFKKVQACVASGQQWYKGNCLKTLPANAK